MPESLTQEQIRELDTKLRQRLVELRADVRAALERSEYESYQVIAGDVPDMEDAAFARMVRALELVDIERDAAEIDDIDAALGRIDAGHYGRCVDCGDPVALERLRAYPSAKRCYDCQKQIERRRSRL